MKYYNFNDTDDLIMAEHRHWMDSKVRSDRTRVAMKKPVFRMQKKSPPDPRYDQESDFWRINESDVVTVRPTLIDKMYTLLYKWLRKQQ